MTDSTGAERSQLGLRARCGKSHRLERYVVRLVLAYQNRLQVSQEAAPEECPGR